MWIVLPNIYHFSESEEKLTNEIKTLLNSSSSQNEISPTFGGDNTINNTPIINQHNAALFGYDQCHREVKPISVESRYSEDVQKMFQDPKSTLMGENENQAVPPVSDDQLSLVTFNRGDSIAMLGTDEKQETLTGTMQSNSSLQMDSTKNLTQPIVPLNLHETNTSLHKPSAGSRFLASVSPEEFLKRLKKHLEISRSNLKILKRNFQDFLKEKERLFRLNQKVAQEHPNPKEIKVSIIRTDDTFQGVSFVKDAQNPAALPQLVNPQPICQICPQDCPVSLIHIDHHHHGNSPVPCICENYNLYAEAKEEYCISG